MTPPIQWKTVLGFDPAFRTGCKLAIVDPTGKFLFNTVIYPTAPQNDTEKSEWTFWPTQHFVTISYKLPVCLVSIAG